MIKLRVISSVRLIITAILIFDTVNILLYIITALSSIKKFNLCQSYYFGLS